MISYDQAIQLILSQAKLISPACVKTDEALAQVCAERVVAQKSLPAFNSSAMDGFAVRASQTLLATPGIPLVLPVSHRIEAGTLLTNRGFGPCVEITTGAVVPDEFDAVIAYEQVDHVEHAEGITKTIKLSRGAQPLQNVRLKGEDLQVGSVLIEPGTQIWASHMAAMAACGVNEMHVRQMPAVDIFSTGAEVQMPGIQNEHLHCGEIYDSNTPYLLNEMKAAGIQARHAGSVGDDPSAFADQINRSTDAAILISTGGVSKGPRDFIAESLIKLGARVLFHGVAIKPGKPMLFAVLNDGRYFFGLPGNPIATAVGLRFFVLPLIRQVLGLSAEIPTTALLTEPYFKKGNIFHFLKARRFVDAQGIVRITLLKDQSAFRVSSLMAMNCWAVVPDAVSSLQTNSPVECIGMELFSRNT